MLQNQTVTQTSPQNSSLYLQRYWRKHTQACSLLQVFKKQAILGQQEGRNIKKKKEQLFQVHSLTLDNSATADYTALLICSWHLCFE